MPFRFKKRIKIFPGFYINLGKTGISTTVGVQGAELNINKTGVTENFAAIGTGVSYRNKIIKFNKPPIENLIISPSFEHFNSVVAKIETTTNDIENIILNRNMSFVTATGYTHFITPKVAELQSLETSLETEFNKIVLSLSNHQITQLEFNDVNILHQSILNKLFTIKQKI